jgi:hypothetical protein
MMVDLLASIRTLSFAILAASGAAITYLLWQQQTDAPREALKRERLSVYNDLMTSIIKLNRQAVELDDEDLLQDSHDRLVLNQESELDGHLEDITETFHQSYYLIDAPVRDAVSEYVDYASSYHESGIRVGQILSLSGNVVQAIREDLGLEDIFSEATEL